MRVLGHDPLRERRAVRPRVGIMLQSGGFAGELTVRETAELWAALGSRLGDVSADLDRLALARKANVRVEQLSGGEQRRLEVALAIHGDPELLLLDEPTTGLDPESRRRTWEVVSELVAAGTTVLLTTHYLDEAEALADRWRSCATARSPSAARSARSPRGFRRGSPSRLRPRRSRRSWPRSASTDASARSCSRRGAAGRPGAAARVGGGRAADARAPQRPQRLPRRRLPGGGGMNRVLTLARAEARILIRNRLVAATGVLLPLLMGLFIASTNTDGAWGNIVAMQLVLMLLFCVYATATTSLAARKRQLVLKRLRSGELSDAEILTGLLAPLFALALAQLVILILCTVASAPRCRAGRGCWCPRSCSGR